MLIEYSLILHLLIVYLSQLLAIIENNNYLSKLENHVFNLLARLFNFLSLIIMHLRWTTFRQSPYPYFHQTQSSIFSSSLISPLLFSILSIASILVTIPAKAEKILGTPGNTWGEIRFPGSAQPEDKHNLIIEGAVEQGIDFYRLSSDSVLNIFSKLDYTSDTEGYDWNRKLKLGAGVKLRHYLSDTTVIAFGAKYEIDKRFVDDRTMDGFQLFSNWYGTWDLPNVNSSDSGRAMSFPGITWGEIRYPGSQAPSEDNDIILEGYVEQGVDWMKLDTLGTINFYANLDYITDSKELDWNNSITSGVGIKLKKVIGSNLLLEFGIEAAHERRWVSDQTDNVVFVYLNWSSWWDPRAIRLNLPE
ncbi:MAG: hypothetical protein KAI17_01530 [Thiotrichaceae bacterium]|nr:hypothetical protein [Thiotrichaceae bacterium]